MSNYCPNNEHGGALLNFTTRSKCARVSGADENIDEDVSEDDSATGNNNEELYVAAEPHDPPTPPDPYEPMEEDMISPWDYIVHPDPVPIPPNHC